MTQQTTSAHTFLGRLWLRLLLVQSLSCSGILSLLSNNLVLAQTSPSPDAVGLPTIKDSKPSAAAAGVEKSAPDTPQSAPSPARLERLRQKLSSASATATRLNGGNPPSGSQSPTAGNPPSGLSHRTQVSSPTRLERLRQKLSSASAPVRQELPKPEVSTLPAPQVSVPKVRSVVKPQIKLPSPVQSRPTRLLEKTATNRATDYNNAYIDPTEYSIGATSGYQAPRRVVLSERSTGCKAVLRQGQGLSGSVCGTTRLRRTRVAVRGIQSSNTVRLLRPQAPSWARRSRAVAKSVISPVRVGPISVSASGFRASSRTPASFRGQFPSVNGVPARGVAYDNRTLRPTGQPGNANTALLFPLTVPATITSLFGWRIHPITGSHRFHSGTDLGAPLGTPVLAAYAGNVAVADFLGGYGLTVVLEHNKFTEQTLYGHLSEIFVQPGEWVEQGTVIGRVGSTGNSTGPHLHFETRQLTPEGWVATDSGAQMEYALAQLVEALRAAQSTQQPGA